jgi:hypothetical protein
MINLLQICPDNLGQICYYNNICWKKRVERGIFLATHSLASIRLVCCVFRVSADVVACWIRLLLSNNKTSQDFACVCVCVTPGSKW